MELVYLWVEEYKNIHKQGFNFSPKFNCHYDDEKNELTINESDDYIENFFGDNINVTAIVGRNGSGKSSLLNTLVNTLDPKDNYIVVFNDNNKLFYSSNIKLNTDLDQCPNISDKLKLLTYLDRENNDVIPFELGATANSRTDKNKWNRYTEIDTSEKEIVRLLAFEIGKIDPSFGLSTFMYLPCTITIKLKEIDELLGEAISFVGFKQRNEVSRYVMTVEDIKQKLLLVEYLRKNGHSDNLLETIQDPNFKTKNEKLLSFDYAEYLVGKTSSINDLTDEVKNTCIRKGGYSYLFDFDLVDEKNRRYSNLSHGEKYIFGQLLNIYFYITQTTIGQVFLLDEPEIALHPDWQKRYMSEILNLLKESKVINHLMFTTHSPFLLSDIPKQNIIFLDKDENGNCKVVDGLKEKKQTFGANIHTLLSDSFFMEDGLVGEFAKGKIDKAIALLNQEKLDEKELKYCEQIISIIGEPIVKNQLQRMLDSKRLSKIDIVNEKIKNLSYELEVLKKHQSKIIKDELRAKGKKRYKERFIDDKNK